jgi:hypothetical protein
VLALPDFAKPFEIHTDASDVALGAVLFQKYPKGSRPVAFFSTLSPAEKNYATYDKELLAVIRATRTWRRLIHGILTMVYTDHQALVTIQNQRVVNRRQARYLLDLADFGSDLVFKYKPGAANVVADALSRVEVAEVNAVSVVHPDSSLLKQFQAAYALDVLTSAFLQGGEGNSNWKQQLHEGLIYQENDGRKL